jgi:hypothetical protein
MPSGSVVAHRGKRLRRGGLNVGEVVAAIAHHRTQIGVCGPGLLRRRRVLLSLSAQLPVEGQHVLKHVIGHLRANPQWRQTEPGHGRITLRFDQRDFQLRPPVRRLLEHQFVGRY